MGFYGKHFSYNGISCDEFGLAIYDIGNMGQGDSSNVASAGEVTEDWIPLRNRSFFYGVRQNTPLSFNIIFGVDPEIKKDKMIVTPYDYLDRWEINKINNWLTAHTDSRKWLEIEQPDTEYLRYYCTITNLQLITHGWFPWAYQCTVTCDSPYAYTYPYKYKYSVGSANADGEKTVSLRSRSNINEFYYPDIKITPKKKGQIYIENLTAEKEEMILDPEKYTDGMTITIHGGDQIIESSEGWDMYEGFNFNFLPLVIGDNHIKLKGFFDIEFICEFPVNPGG